jgi:hypothetical protein
VGLRFLVVPFTGGLHEDDQLGDEYGEIDDEDEGDDLDM